MVNRDGELCAYAANQADPTQVWPGSQAIAKAKAYTATNGASVFTHPLCVNTWRNGVFVGDEQPAAGY